MFDLSHESSTRKHDDVSGYEYLHVVSHFYCDEKACNSETRGVFKIAPANPLGACLQSVAGDHLDTSQTPRSRNEMSDVSRAGRADGQNVRSNQRHHDGRLFELPQRPRRARRLLNVPFMAARELTQPVNLEGAPEFLARRSQ